VIGERGQPAKVGLARPALDGSTLAVPAITGTDLCSFCNGDSLPAVAQAALAHAQFETIHPFADGNGRTGRGLIHLVLRRRGLATRVLPPISLVLATWASDYVNGLAATRYHGPATGKEAHEGLNLWIGRFAVRAHAQSTTGHLSSNASSKSRTGGERNWDVSAADRPRTCSSVRCREHPCLPSTAPQN
jgi:hypothetical protein